MDAGNIRRLGLPQDHASLRAPAAPPEKKQAPARQSAAPAQQAPATGTLAPITPDEREYFERLFPGSSEEVRSYPGYSPSGIREAAVSGTLIDRKG